MDSCTLGRLSGRTLVVAFAATLIAALSLGASDRAAAQSGVALEDRPTDPVGDGLYGPLDRAPASPLYALPEEVAPGVFSAIGATQPPTYENTGHNNNLSFVIGDRGVLVINGGAAPVLAEALHQEIKARTDLPVLYAVAENGQGHAMLGMTYWNAEGVEVIAHEDAAAVFDEDADAILQRMIAYNRDKSVGAGAPTVDRTFSDRLTLDLGGVTAELIHYGPAHSPGDISVAIRERNVMIAGDMAFHVRMPPIFEDTDTAGWLASWETFAEDAADMIIIPGHGGPTDIAAVDAGTRVYVAFLRAEVGEILDAGGSLEDAYKIDQTPFAHWHTYWELAARNAGRVYEAMEFE